VARNVPERAAELLTSEPLIAHLGTCHDGKPHVAPLWFNYRAGEVEIATTGRKLANIEQNPRVALSVQRDVDGHAQWGVTVRGTATVVADDDEADELFRRLNRKYGADDDAWADENTAVRIDVGSVEYWEYDEDER
jgi:PPOX class probable F420-dependent enzyme